VKTPLTINGELFAERLLMPSFNAAMRLQLIRACEFSWEKISPAIFGSLFQSILRKEERRKQGAHYTTEKNILKVIEPLFLDDLNDEFERLKTRRDSNRASALVEFQRKLASLRFLDPACGCGNFLVIAYREVRELEIQVLKERFPLGQYELLDVATLSLIDVDQFYGIEINVSGALRSRIVDDGSHHEQSPERRIRKSIRADSAAKVSAYPLCRRVGERLG
jgi:hypothetical protein